MTSIAHCSFLRIGDPDNQDYNEYVGIGLFTYEEFDYYGSGSGNCEKIPEWVKNDFEAPEKTARAFGVIAAVLTGLAMVVVVLMQLILDTRFNKVLWIIVRIFYGFAIISQLLTFIVFASDRWCLDAYDEDEICVAGPAGIISALNVAFLIAVSIMTCTVKAPTAVFNLFGTEAGEHQKDWGEEEAPGEYGEDDKFHAPQPRTGGSEVPRTGGSEAVETIVEIGYDGTKKTTRTMINPDGSKTITTTIERV